MSKKSSRRDEVSEHTVTFVKIVERWLMRLSQKNRKLQSYAWSRLRKNVPKSSNVNCLIKNTALITSENQFV